MKTAIVIGVLLLLALLVGGCAPTMEKLGEVKLLDGRTLESIQASSKGQDGPKVSAIEFWLYDPATEVSKKVGEYAAAGKGILSDILQGTGSALLHAGGYAGAAYLRKPNRSTTTVTTGDVDAKAGAIQHQGQLQVQDQYQVQVQDQEQSQEQSAEGGHGCPGNSCGNGPPGHNHED